MNAPDRPLWPARGHAFDISARPEWIVGLGFRCSITCIRASDPGCARQACAVLGSAVEARAMPVSLVTSFSAWAMAVEATAERHIAVLPAGASGLCRDECLAIALVAACQYGACPALQACAFALLGSSDLGRAIAATQNVAHALLGARCRLDADGIVDLARIDPQGRVH
jgi:hypothetical protein